MTSIIKPVNESDSMHERISCIATTLENWVYRYAIPIDQYNHLIDELKELKKQIEQEVKET